MREALSEQWRNILANELDQAYFRNLEIFLEEAYKTEQVFPSRENIFRAYNRMKIEDIKVVIIGQDPYHDENQAHGLAFSVQEGCKIPPSLRNIFKELVDDMGCTYPTQGDLSTWEKQGVLLLNRVLSVQAHKAGSHRKRGWEQFTKATVEGISLTCKRVVFVLWGNDARLLSKVIDSDKHLILESAHPSPLSAHRGFFGSKLFSKTNKYLEEHAIDTIYWCLEQ